MAACAGSYFLEIACWDAAFRGWFWNFIKNLDSLSFFFERKVHRSPYSAFRAIACAFVLLILWLFYTVSATCYSPYSWMTWRGWSGIFLTSFPSPIRSQKSSPRCRSWNISGKPGQSGPVKNNRSFRGNRCLFSHVLSLLSSRASRTVHTSWSAESLAIDL